MGCEHLYKIRVDRPTLYESNPSVEHRCRLKDVESTMLEMSGRHANQGHGSIMTIGRKCPFAESSTFSQCDWFE